MNINRKVLAMALGGAVIPWGLAFADDSLPTPRPLTSVGRISDTPSSVGNSTFAPQRPTLSVDRRPEAFRENAIGIASHPSSNQPSYHPASYSADPTAYESSPILDHSVTGSGVGCGSGCGEACGSSCGSSCSTGCCSSDIGLSCGGGNMLGWADTDVLLWWPQASRTPPLVAQGTTGFPLTNVLLGGDEAPMTNQLVPGLRTDVGFWLDDCRSIGVGGRVFGLFSDPNSNRYSSEGTPSLGIPFLNATLVDEDAYLVAFDTQAPGVNSGWIQVDEETDLIAAEAYGRFLLARCGNARAELLGGYTFLRLDNSLGVATSTLDGETNAVQNGTVTTSQDLFATQNTFHGGHIGISTDITKGRFTVSTIGKVALGNMHQEGLIAGSRVVTAPNGGGVTNVPSGVLTKDSNIGSYDRDTFTFIPEAGAKLRMCLKSNWKFNVGYTFIFLPDVATAGSMIDPVIDVNLPQVVPSPRGLFPNSSYYLHGIDLGLAYEF